MKVDGEEKRQRWIVGRFIYVVETYWDRGVVYFSKTLTFELDVPSPEEVSLGGV